MVTGSVPLWQLQPKYSLWLMLPDVGRGWEISYTKYEIGMYTLTLFPLVLKIWAGSAKDGLRLVIWRFSSIPLINSKQFSSVNFFPLIL